MSVISENVQQIRADIEEAARKAGRRAADITLVGVTKTVAPAAIQEALSLGVTTLGENRVQEFLPKYETLQANTPAPTWHMIGHLQTNKVKYIIEKVKLIQSLDSLPLAEEINKRAAQHHLCADVLIEINIANEPTKHGIHPEKLQPFIEHLSKLPNICVKGLMCVAPYVEIAVQNRKVFEKMMKLFIDNQVKSAHNISMFYLSMGMTHDFRTAIAEGANMVRIGSGLFGART